MLKQRNEQIQILVRVLDLLVCVVAFFAAYAFRDGTTFFPHDLAPVDSLAWMLATSVTVHWIIYPYFGFYGSLRLKRVLDIVRMVGKAWILETLILGSLVFALQAKYTSRSFFGIFLAFNYLLILIEKIGARAILSSIRRRGYNFRKVLIAGHGSNAQSLIDTLHRNKHWGYLPVGFLTTTADDTGAPQEWNGLPRLGKLGDLPTVIQRQSIDEVYFAPDIFDGAAISGDLLICEKLGIPARFSLRFAELKHSRVAFAQLESIPVLTFYTTLMTPVGALLKRMIDIGVSLVGLAITATLYPWISWRIRRESPGPVIFKQIRVGENGRIFKCYKFRTMIPDAEAQKASLLGQNQMSGPIFKMERDPRITRFGAFLRASSLDELPQFLNILRGDMSVVGTRPPTPDEVKAYELQYRRRLSIRPGLTGLWQVSGRSQIKNFEDVVALDLKYIDTWSIWLDLKIILRTIFVAFFRRGAA